SAAQVTVTLAKEVRRRLAAGPDPAYVVVEDDAIRSDRGAQRVEHLGRDRRGRHGHVGPRRPLVDTEDGLDQGTTLVGQRGGGSRVTPASGWHLNHIDHVLQSYTWCHSSTMPWMQKFC